MNARGSTEVIVATIGLSMGALNPNLFTMIVTMAVITTMAMPPTLRWALARIPMRKEEKQRLEREEMEERGFVPKLERLLLAVDESANGRFASRIAGLIAGANALPTTVHAHRRTDKKTGKAAERPSQTAEKGKRPGDDAAETVKVFAGHVERAQTEEEKTDTKLDVTTMVEKSPRAQRVAAEAEKGYDLMLVGLEKTVATAATNSTKTSPRLAAGFEGPIAIADVRDKLLEHPLHGKLAMLVPVNGTEMSRRAAEVAIAMARASKASLTALYVAAARQEKRGGLAHAPSTKRPSSRTSSPRRKLRNGAAHHGAAPTSPPTKPS